MTQRLSPMNFQDFSFWESSLHLIPNIPMLKLTKWPLSDSWSDLLCIRRPRLHPKNPIHHLINRRLLFFVVLLLYMTLGHDLGHCPQMFSGLQFSGNRGVTSYQTFDLRNHNFGISRFANLHRSPG
jgi:hypothetical protein